MCTVTFIARERGFLLGMNRDEKRTRATGLPPEISKGGGRSFLAPSEPGGGTWIGLRDDGACFALINWYSVRERADSPAISRGEVIPAAVPGEKPDDVQGNLERLAMERINPFRLIAIFPRLGALVEWQWDRKRLAHLVHPWRTQQWISSGFDEPRAQRERSRVFECACRRHSADGLAWLRKLHRSHGSEIGPYSTCMHRADAATVSYTQVRVSTRWAEMRYHAGAPCEKAPDFIHRFRGAAVPERCNVLISIGPRPFPKIRIQRALQL